MSRQLSIETEIKAMNIWLFDISRQLSCVIKTTSMNMWLYYMSGQPYIETQSKAINMWLCDMNISGQPSSEISRSTMNLKSDTVH